MPLRFVPLTVPIPVIQGPLRGRRWLAGSSNHGCWLGSYEFDKQRQIAAAVQPGMVCFDIGANVGFYTLLFSKLAGPRGAVVAFEPVARNCTFLHRHIQLNACTNVLVRELAVTDFDGAAGFELTQCPSQGHLAAQGRLAVTCARVDSLVLSKEMPIPDIIKIDVEGAEKSVLDGARQVIARHKPAIFLATHGEQQRHECCSILLELGYTLSTISGVPIENSDEIVASWRSLQR